MGVRLRRREKYGSNPRGGASSTRHRHAKNVTETMATSRKTRRRQALTLSITSWWSLGRKKRCPEPVISVQGRAQRLLDRNRDGKQRCCTLNAKGSRSSDLHLKLPPPLPKATPSLSPPWCTPKQACLTPQRRRRRQKQPLVCGLTSAPL